jgi:ribosomal silencing factor RsfS
MLDRLLELKVPIDAMTAAARAQPAAPGKVQFEGLTEKQWIVADAGRRVLNLL